MLLSVQSIELNNFMTHRQEKVSLPPTGTVLLWGPSGAGKCLPAATTLWSPEGTPLRIEEVVHGKFPEVIGVVDGKVQVVPVTDWHDLGHKPILQLTLGDGTILFCAESHPVMTMGGCIRADQLVVGVRVGRADPVLGQEVRWQEITEIKSCPQMHCYDITVDTEEHLYLAEGVVVHNSSLLDAVGFALYGVNATRAANLEELRHELYPEEDFGVRLTLALGENKIQIFRGLEGNKTVTWMVGTDGAMTEGPRAVATQVEELMGGMDAATFFATYYSQQGELDNLVKMAGGGRRKFVQRMLGITLLDKVSTQINRELAKSSDRITFLDESLPEAGKSEIAAGAALTDKELKTLQAEMEAGVTEMSASEVSGSALAAKLEKVAIAAETAGQLGPLVDSLQETTLPALGEQITELKSQIEEAKQAQVRAVASAQQTEQREALEAEAEQLADAEGALSAASALQEQQQQAEKALQEALQALEALSKPQAPEHSPQQLTERLHALHTDLALLSSRQQQLSEQQALLTDAPSCPLCRQRIEDPSALIEEMQQELEALLKGQQDKSSAHQELESQLEKASVLAEEHLAWQALQAAASSKVEHLEADLERSAQQVLTAQSSASSADSKRLAEVRRLLQAGAQQAASMKADQTLAEALPAKQNKLEEAEQKLKDGQQKLKEAQQKLGSLDYDADAYRELREATELARSQYVELRDRLAQQRERKAQLSADLQAAQAALKHYDAVVADRASAESRHALLSRLDSSMKSFKSHMIGQIRPLLQSTASAHLSALTEGRMSSIEIDEDYNLSIVTGEGIRRLGLCSGGEQARAAFALRLALTQLVSKRTDTPIGFMVFDEIFASQDEGHRRAILESLRYLRGIYPQILIISHESSMRDSELVDVIVDVPDSDSAGRIQVSNR